LPRILSELTSCLQKDLVEFAGSCLARGSCCLSASSQLCFPFNTRNLAAAGKEVQSHPFWHPFSSWSSSFGSLATGTVNGLKRSRESWFSYELTIGNDFLRTKIKDFPELEIRQHEITAIKENADGLRVETGTKGQAIWISTDLVEYQDARARLSRWMPVQESGGWRTSGRWAYISSVLSTSLLVCFYVVSIRRERAGTKRNHKHRPATRRKT
jgi:hypothetical protein